MKTFKSVDTYISQTPSKYHAKLNQLRQLIKETAPDAEEKISYGMPYYSYYGRLIFFQLFTHHIGIYIPTPVLQDHEEELKRYETTDATLRLPLEEDLPLNLLKKLIKARMKLNEEKQQTKES